MSLYPSLEDMKVDQMAKAQVEVQAQLAYQANAPAAVAYGAFAPPMGSLYAGLGLEEFLDYGGLNISEEAIRQQMPGEVGLQVVQTMQSKPLVSVTPANSLDVKRSEIKQGVREVVLAKDQSGTVGLAVQHIDKGVFVSFVWKDSAASLGGLRFGDQILQINGENVAGWNNDKTIKFIRKADPQRIVFAVRDRPFARVVTVVKDHQNQIGFLFKNGQISAIVKDSSAARNGLLIHHNIVEVNGQNVVGMKDDDILRIFKEAPRSLCLTIMPSFVYDHLIKNIGMSQIRKYMDHSVPEM